MTMISAIQAVHPAPAPHLISRLDMRLALGNVLEQFMSAYADNNHPYRRFAPGLTGLHQISNLVYPLAQSGPAAAHIANSAAWAHGYQFLPATAHRRALSAKWIPLIDSLMARFGVSADELNTHIRQQPDLLAEFDADWIDESYRGVLAQAGIDPACVIWNWLVFRTDYEPHQQNANSGAWHYDNHYPPSSFKIMFYLNDYAEHQSGTDILDAANSKSISDRTGYMGFLPNRLSDISAVATPEEAQGTTQLRPDTGEAIIFWPGRCLHRGFYRTGRKARYVISLSLMPGYAVDYATNRAIYDRLVPDFITGVDAPATFLPVLPGQKPPAGSTLPNLQSADEIINWIRFDSGWLTPAHGQLEADVFAHLTQFLPADPNSDVLTRLQGLAELTRMTDISQALAILAAARRK